ncbi:MAG: hypothetical protein GXZ01_08000 [Clostridiaceae bacterium]|jgi:hypothetical protein|nr:hypothetical protein [Clostridiaceae bacterium]
MRNKITPLVLNIGVTNGTSETTFSPKMLLNREQAATMLNRVYKKVTMLFISLFFLFT